MGIYEGQVDGHIYLARYGVRSVIGVAADSACIQHREVQKTMLGVFAAPLMLAHTEGDIL